MILQHLHFGFHLHVHCDTLLHLPDCLQCEHRARARARATPPPPPQQELVFCCTGHPAYQATWWLPVNSFLLSSFPFPTSDLSVLCFQPLDRLHIQMKSHQLCSCRLVIPAPGDRCRRYANLRTDLDIHWDVVSKKVKGLGRVPSLKIQYPVPTQEATRLRGTGDQDPWGSPVLQLSWTGPDSTIFSQTLPPQLLGQSNTPSGIPVMTRTHPAFLSSWVPRWLPGFSLYDLMSV